MISTLIAHHHHMIATGAAMNHQAILAIPAMNQAVQTIQAAAATLHTLPTRDHHQCTMLLTLQIIQSQPQQYKSTDQ